MEEKKNKNGINRREFILSVVATAAGGACAVADEMPVVTFGMVSDLHYAELPDAIDDPGTRCFKDAPLKLRDAVKVMNGRKVDFMIELGDFKDMMATKEATLKCLDDFLCGRRKRCGVSNGRAYRACKQKQKQIKGR